jgi:hypothetical protein
VRIPIGIRCTEIVLRWKQLKKKTKRRGSGETVSRPFMFHYQLSAASDGAVTAPKLKLSETFRNPSVGWGKN